MHSVSETRGKDLIDFLFDTVDLSDEAFYRVVDILIRLNDLLEDL